MKYLIWAVVLYFAWRWYLVSKEKSVRADAQGDAASGSGANRRDDSAPATTNATASTTATSAAATAVEARSEKMVGCAHCGVHLPLSEALTEVLNHAQPGAQSRAEPRHYCCEEHRALHARA